MSGGANFDDNRARSGQLFNLDDEGSKTSTTASSFLDLEPTNPFASDDGNRATQQQPSFDFDFGSNKEESKDLEGSKTPESRDKKEKRKEKSTGKNTGKSKMLTFDGDGKNIGSALDFSLLNAKKKNEKETSIKTMLTFESKTLTPVIPIVAGAAAGAAATGVAGVAATGAATGAAGAAAAFSFGGDSGTPSSSVFGASTGTAAFAAIAAPSLGALGAPAFGGASFGGTTTSSFGVVPPAAAAAAATTGSGWEAKLLGFYQKYQPAKANMIEVQKILKKYVNQEGIMFGKLFIGTKYHHKSKQCIKFMLLLLSVQ